MFFQALLGELDSAAKFSYFNQEGSSGVTAYKKENHSARPSLKQAMSQSPPRYVENTQIDLLGRALRHESETSGGFKAERAWSVAAGEK